MLRLVSNCLIGTSTMYCISFSFSNNGNIPMISYGTNNTVYFIAWWELSYWCTCFLLSFLVITIDTLHHAIQITQSLSFSDISESVAFKHIWLTEIQLVLVVEVFVIFWLVIYFPATVSLRHCSVKELETCYRPKIRKIISIAMCLCTVLKCSWHKYIVFCCWF